MVCVIYLYVKNFYGICKNIVMNICRYKLVFKKFLRLIDIWLRFFYRFCCKNYLVRVNLVLLDYK